MDKYWIKAVISRIEFDLSNDLIITLEGINENTVSTNENDGQKLNKLRNVFLSSNNQCAILLSLNEKFKIDKSFSDVALNLYEKKSIATFTITVDSNNKCQSNEDSTKNINSYSIESIYLGR